MTWTLLREQVRSQRSYAVWTVLLIAAAVALASYAWTVDRTYDAQAHAYADAAGEAREVSAQVALYPPDGSAAPDIAEYGVPMTEAGLDTLLAEANAEGAGAVASLQGMLLAIEPDAQGSWADPAAVQWGDVRWDDAIAQGRPPGPGEIALEASSASALGVDLGDAVTIQLESEQPSQAAVVESRTLVGLAYDSAMWPAGHWPVGRAYLPAEDASAAVAAMDASLVGWDGVRLGYTTVAVSWDVTTPVLAQAFPETWTFGGYWSEPLGIVAPVGLAIAVALGVVATAFAVGRARAASRVQWTATARALGATRGRIAAATVAEGLLLGLVGAALGLACALGVAALQYSQYRQSVEAPLPVPLTTSAGMNWLALGGGLALGLISAAIPALLATRVSPSAALKALPAVDEATVSRRVSAAPVTIAFALLYVAFLAAAAGATQEEAPWSILLCVGALVTFVPVLVESARRLAGLLGASLSRRRHPALVQAGTAIAAHPRQAAILATVQAVTMTALVGVTSTVTITFGSATYSPWTLTAAALGATQALCAGAWSATRRLTAGDDATAAALGLDARALGLAHAVRYGAPQVAGAMLGALAGLIVVLPAATAMAIGWWLTLSGPADDSVGPLWTLVASLTTITALVNVALIALSAAVAGVVRQRDRPRTQISA
ncbi:FtsX-like permease family protein [Demequina sp. NBRC 110053]|uniref:FtsX-like permease family protein n=1 Tax=Demequina sp. NBRC 110053 TaxID=1570342 RepID=UPI000A041F1D|nr:FtsX-like permease family protein [Demequina sp. NBRC 110053]